MGLIKVNRGNRPVQEKDKLTKDEKRLDEAKTGRHNEDKVAAGPKGKDEAATK